jgi:uncharacterized protein Yka (UPF0111/DUF47 family)
MLGWLFPDQRKFYTRFSGIAQGLTRAATLLEQALNDPARMSEISGAIDRVEQEADAAAHELDVGVDQMFIPPMDREDIHLLTTRLSRVADIIGGAARRAVSLRATARHESAVALARILLEAVREIEGAIDHIRDNDEVMARCRRIKRAEEAGDQVWESAVAEMFAGQPDPLDVMRWKAVYDQLEDALDACEDVANELETITVKHV